MALGRAHRGDLVDVDRRVGDVEDALDGVGGEGGLRGRVHEGGHFGGCVYLVMNAE